MGVENLCRTRLNCLKSLVACLLIFFAHVSSASDCSRVLKKAFQVIRKAHKQSDEPVNLGWSAQSIAESLYEEGDDFLVPVKVNPNPSSSEKLNARLHLEKGTKFLADEFKLQDQTKYNRERLDNAKEVANKAVIEYLSNSGVEFFVKNPDFSFSLIFCHISVNGDHALNRAARAIYSELGLHILITGKTLKTFDNYIQIPPTLFSKPKDVDKIISYLNKILIPLHDTPSVFVNLTSPHQNQMQDKHGKRKLLNWNALLNQKFRVKRLPPPPSELQSRFITNTELLNTFPPSLQEVFDAETFVLRFPENIRKTALRSISTKVRETKNPYVYVAIEIEGDWYDIWPQDSEPADIESISRYLNYFLKDRRFLSVVSNLDEIKLHIMVGDPHKADPISTADIETYESLKSEVYSAIHPIRKKLPPIYFDLAKIALFRREPLVFKKVEPYGRDAHED